MKCGGFAKEEVRKLAKRFTNSDKWKDKFLKNLPCHLKLFWFYIQDDCDHAGIWQVDMEVASIRVGEELNLEECKEAFKEEIVIFDNDEMWFIPSFIDFQYGALNPENRVHKSILLLLDKALTKGLIRPLEGCKDKDKDKDKAKAQDKRRAREKPEYSVRFSEAWKVYGSKGSKGDAAVEFDNAVKNIRKRADAPSDVEAWLVERAGTYAKLHDTNNEKKHRKDLERWLKGKLYDFDDETIRESGGLTRQDNISRVRAKPGKYDNIGVVKA